MRQDCASSPAIFLSCRYFDPWVIRFVPLGRSGGAASPSLVRKEPTIPRSPTICAQLLKWGFFNSYAVTF
jgi:hypothetical protein